MAIVRITLQRLLHHQRQARKALPHISVACCQPYSHPVRNLDHCNPSASSTRRRISASTSQSTRTRRPPPSSISMMPLLQRRQSGDADGAGASTAGSTAAAGTSQPGLMRRCPSISKRLMAEWTCIRSDGSGLALDRTSGKSRCKVPYYDQNTVSPRRNDPYSRTKTLQGVLEETPPEGAKFPVEKETGMGRAYNGPDYYRQLARGRGLVRRRIHHPMIDWNYHSQDQQSEPGCR